MFCRLPHPYQTPTVGTKGETTHLIKSRTTTIRAPTSHITPQNQTKPSLPRPWPRQPTGFKMAGILRANLTNRRKTTAPGHTAGSFRGTSTTRMNDHCRPIYLRITIIPSLIITRIITRITSLIWAWTSRCRASTPTTETGSTDTPWRALIRNRRAIPNVTWQLPQRRRLPTPGYITALTVTSSFMISRCLTYIRVCTRPSTRTRFSAHHVWSTVRIVLSLCFTSCGMWSTLTRYRSTSHLRRVIYWVKRIWRVR